VDVAVRPARRVTPHDAFEDRLRAGQPQPDVQAAEAHVEQRRGVDDREAREARGIAQRGVQAQQPAERVARRGAAGDPERLLQLADEGAERRGRQPPVHGRDRAAAAAGQVGHDEAIAVAEALEQVAPRVARGHQAVDQQQRGRVRRAVGDDVRRDRAERRGRHDDGLGLCLEVAVRQPRALGEILEAPLMEGAVHPDELPDRPRCARAIRRRPVRR
jgi:hypothetical protein